MEIPPPLRDFQARWESPALGLFHGAASSTARFAHKLCCRAEHIKPWPYTDANMVVSKAYSSNRHWLIAEVILSGGECDGPPDEAFTSQWFVITPEQQVRFLGSNMWLVDAGDYDNDGKSELVFSIDDNNRGGYKLFYDDFSRIAMFEFSYH